MCKIQVSEEGYAVIIEGAGMFVRTHVRMQTHVEATQQLNTYYHTPLLATVVKQGLFLPSWA